ncbi:hypothetical protein OG948_02110 [Embleya sp. NBC_00888]|uniref:hypothetical protein n=1 Tax=Embleya sp. NBC_00888 TaxID=2975960 RepID=UPI00386AB30F|nr:hypothetical protein OG948_02110 [Embleya sp. NBC_00888]
MPGSAVYFFGLGGLAFLLSVIDIPWLYRRFAGPGDGAAAAPRWGKSFGKGQVGGILTALCGFGMGLLMVNLHDRSTWDRDSVRSAADKFAAELSSGSVLEGFAGSIDYNTLVGTRLDSPNGSRPALRIEGVSGTTVAARFTIATDNGRYAVCLTVENGGRDPADVPIQIPNAPEGRTSHHDLIHARVDNGPCRAT